MDIPVSRELKKRVKFVLLRDDYLNLIDTLRNLHCNVTKNPVGLEHMFLKLSLTSGGHQNFCFDQAWGGEGGSDGSSCKIGKNKICSGKWREM